MNPSSPRTGGSVRPRRLSSPPGRGQGWVYGPNALQTVNLVNGFDELGEG